MRRFDVKDGFVFFVLVRTLAMLVVLFLLLAIVLGSR